MIIVIGIIYILYQVIKAACEDSYVKDTARRNGMDWYASSTGIRDIRTNKKVFLNSDGTKKFLE